MIKRVAFSNKDKDVLEKLPHDSFIDDMKDQFDYSRVVIEKPWGHEYSIFKNDKVDTWLLFIKPGNRTSMHCHPAKKTSMVVLCGEAAISTLGETNRISQGDGLVIEKGVFHCTEAISPRGIYLLEIETPINKKNLVRFDDVYGRTGRRYESGKYVQPRNPAAMPSFYEPEESGTVKKFGDCELVVVNIKNKDHLFDMLPALSRDTIVMLQGEIRNNLGNTIFSHADAFHSHELLDIYSDIAVTDGASILLIRNI